MLSAQRRDWRRAPNFDELVRVIVGAWHETVGQPFEPRD